MILKSLIEKKAKKQKSLSVLIDPDKIVDDNALKELIFICSRFSIDYIFVGGSLMVSDNLNTAVHEIKSNSDIPVILFPGSNLHIDKSADAILFLSLISGRNPDLLIGQHVAAAPILKRSKLEILPTGYILAGNDSNTTVAHISRTSPIPTEKVDIAVCTALAGEMLGLKLIYLDAGSGAKQEVPAGMIAEVNNSIKTPLIVGGGINSAVKIKAAFEAGADLLVLGTAVEKRVEFISEAASVRDAMNVIHS